jgi:CheY-like chemotaxis protein
MALESLLVTRDPEMIRVLRPALEKFLVETEVCRGAKSGNAIVCTEKFDAIIIDCDDLQGGLDVLRGLRKTPSNRSSIAFAVLNGSTTTQDAFSMGANFVMQKPVTAANAERCLSAAIGLMQRCRRRYYRHPVDCPATLIFGKDTERKVTATNVSEGGMAVSYRGKFPSAGLNEIRFALPGKNIVISTKAELAWADDKGRAGIKFVEVSKETAQDLEAWIAEHLDQAEARP